MIARPNLTKYRLLMEEDENAENRSSLMSFAEVKELLTLRERERDDLKRDLRAELCDSHCDQVYLQVKDRLRESGEIASAAQQELVSRMRLLIPVAAVVVAVLGFFGYKSIEQMAQFHVMQELDDRFEEREESIRKAEDILDEKLLNTRSDLDTKVLEAKDRIRFLVAEEMKEAEKSITDKLKANNEDLARRIDGAIQMVTMQINENLKIANDKLDAAVSDTNRELTERIRVEEERFVRAIRDQRLEETKSYQSAISQTRPDLPLLRATASGEDNEQEMMVQRFAILGKQHRREFGTILEDARSYVNKGYDSLARAAIDPLLAVPGMFSDFEHEEAVKIAFGDGTDELEIWSRAAEFLYAGIRADSDFMVKSGEHRIRRSPLFEPEIDGFEMFGLAIAEREPVLKLMEIFKKVDFTHLTARGLANLLAAMKKGALPEDLCGDVESRLIELILTTEAIDRPSDYPIALMFAQALVSEPIAEGNQVARALNHIEEFVLSDDLPDPWGLETVLKSVEVERVDSIESGEEVVK